MNKAINFSGVQAPEQKQFIRTTQPKIGEFTIDKTEYGESPTPFLQVHFSDVNSAFRQKFYLTEKALGRLQHLAEKATGTQLEGDITPEQLSAKLVGRKVRLLVDGDKVFKDGVERIYPNLRYAGFAESVNVESKFTTDMIKVIPRVQASDMAPAKEPDFSGVDASGDSDLPF